MISIKNIFLCFVKKFDFFREHDIKAVFLKLLCIYNMSKDKEVFLIVKYSFCVFTFVFYVARTSKGTPLSRPAALICNAHLAEIDQGIRSQVELLIAERAKQRGVDG